MVTKETSKRCESDTRFQKTCHIMRSGRWIKMRPVVQVMESPEYISFRGLSKSSSRARAWFVITVSIVASKPLPAASLPSLANLPGLQDSRIASF